MAFIGGTFSILAILMRVMLHLTFGETELRAYKNSLYYFCNSFVSLKLYHNENLKIKKCFSYIADPFCCTVETNTTV